MAHSIIVREGNGSTNTFTLGFTLGVLDRSLVDVQVGDEDRGIRTIEWITDGLVTISGAAPGDGVRVVFRRTMNKAELIHNYDNGDPIEEANLDESNLQNLMSVHEVLDGRLTSISEDLDMQTYKIINLGDGEDDADAANMRQLNETITEANSILDDTEDARDLAEDWANKTSGNVDGAEFSAKAYAVGGTGVTDTAGKGAAKEWATKTSGTVDGTSYSAKEYAQGTQSSTGGSAKNWAQQTGADVTGAATHSRSSKSWAQEDLTGATLGGSAKDWAQSSSLPDGTSKSAKSYATDAAASAAAALTSENNAETAETNAETAQGLAEDARDLAQKWASEDEDVVVSGGEYSAYHWAQKAADVVNANADALSVKGNATNSPAIADDITASTDHQVLRRNGTSLSFGAISLDQAAAVTGMLPLANGGGYTDAASARVAFDLEIGTDVQAHDADLDALAGVSTTGILTRTGAGTAAARTVTGTSNRISVSNGNGVSGDPTIDISSSYVGQNTITTLGTVTTGEIRVYINTSEIRHNLMMNNLEPLYLRRNSDGNIQAFDRSGGVKGTISINTSNVAYNTTSDYRVKYDWRPLSKPATDTLMQVPVYSLMYKGTPGVRVIGILAHELQERMPEAVTGTKDAMQNIGVLRDIGDDGAVLREYPNIPEPKAGDLKENQTWEKTDTVELHQQVDYSKLVIALLAMNQEQQKRIENLESTVATIRDKLNVQ